MSDTIIKVENVSKSYVLKQQNKERYTTLRDTVIDKLKGKNLKSAHHETFWALNDVSFEVKQGERVGIIGRNGAGKSTLLKVLSRIVTPTKGRITIDGRIASLLEVGTGFHPELSGRENIYLNGAILGMSKSEINSKFDEIVAFAEVEKFLDTPVKRYSSGMYVRLAFAVAAHLEPEVLVVDEVLAVGDAEFQKKCLGKMKDVAGEGRTVLFVSHNMEAVQKLCDTGILLQKGSLVEANKIEPLIKKYLDLNQFTDNTFDIPLPSDKDAMPAYAYQLITEDLHGKRCSEFPVGKGFQVRVKFKVNKTIEGFVIALGLTSGLNMALQTTWTMPQNIEPGYYEVLYFNTELIYTSGMYNLVVGLSAKQRNIQYVEEAGTLTISDVVELENEAIINTKSGLLINQMNTKIVRVS